MELYKATVQTAKGKIDVETHLFLEKLSHKLPAPNTTKLVSTNKEAFRQNAKALHAFPGEAVQYRSIDQHQTKSHLKYIIVDEV